jgi:hypothetical protein
VRPPNKKRYLIFLAVAGVHALVIAVLLSTSRSNSLSSPTTIHITAFFLTRPARPNSRIAHPSLNETYARPIVEPITVAPPALSLINPRAPAVDWEAEAKWAAAKIGEPGKRISFGFPAPGDSAIQLGKDPPSPLHYAGEQYRTEGGEQIYWLNDHCYMESDPPSLFEPDFLKNARVSRIGCK